MHIRVRAYVAAIVTAALGAIICLRDIGGTPGLVELRAGLAFAALGLVCQAYMYQMHRTAAGGSIGSIPFLAAAAVAPSWQTALFVAVAVAAGEVLRRSQPIKGIFNVAQHALAVTLGICGYLAFEGHSFVFDERFRVVPYAMLLSIFIATNSVTVSGVVSIDSGQPWMAILRRQNSAKLPYDALASPLVYIFALVYNRFALAGIIFLGLLLLGARQLYRTNWQLEQTNRELLEVMVASIELRDAYTSGHSQRVAEYSIAIGRAAGLSHRQIDRLRIAALLHDVGKIDQRFAAILQKPGRLTEEERGIIELHPVISADLVARISGLADIVPSVRNHHERWDGRGYPDGLAADAIPLFARIITFADTIDAMTTDRPYRPALGATEVRAELLRNRGKQFDPSLCDRLLASPAFQEIFGESDRSTSRRQRAESAIAA